METVIDVKAKFFASSPMGFAKPIPRRKALKHGMTYVRQSQEEHEVQMKEKQIKVLRRKARLLGLEIIEKPSGSDATGAAASVQG